MLECAGCKEQCPKSQMCPYTTTSMMCYICKTNYNRNTERVKVQPTLKLWWRNLSKEAKAEWFKSNKGTYTPNKKHSFDTAGEYAEGSVEKKRRTDESRYNYLTEDDWCLRTCCMHPKVTIDT